MEITEVRVKLVNVKNDKLRAFCSITVDNDFVIRDLKVIEGAKGAFVAMPSRKLTERCSRCGGKNHYRARYCNDCGSRLSGGGERAPREGGTQKMHTDIAHPINSRCREVIQKRVLEVYQEEVQKSGDPDYRPMELEVFDEDSLTEETMVEVVGPAGGAAPAAETGEPEAVETNAGTENGGHGQPREARPHSDGPSERRGFRPGGEGRREGGGGDRRGRGRFRGGFGDGRREGRDQGREHPRDNRREQGRSEHSRSEPRPPNGGGRGGERERESDREGFPRTAPAPQSLSAAPPPERPRPAREEKDPEPEDNFGAGLFN